MDNTPPRRYGRYLLAGAGISAVSAEAMAREQDNWGPGWHPAEGGG